MSPTIMVAQVDIVVGQSCGTHLLAGNSCPMVASYTPRKHSWSNTQSAVLSMDFDGRAKGNLQSL